MLVVQKNLCSLTEMKYIKNIIYYSLKSNKREMYLSDMKAYKYMTLQKNKHNISYL